MPSWVVGEDKRVNSVFWVDVACCSCQSVTLFVVHRFSSLSVVSTSATIPANYATASDLFAFDRDLNFRRGLLCVCLLQRSVTCCGSSFKTNYNGKKRRMKLLTSSFIPMVGSPMVTTNTYVDPFQSYR